MRTGYCRYCKRDIYNDLDYYGYCSIGCCGDFAAEQKISMVEAKSINSCEDKISQMEDEILQLQCDYDNVSNEASNSYDDMDKAEDKIHKLEKIVKELESLDWEEIKKEREREAVYNETVLEKVKNIKKDNDWIKEKMGGVQRDNILLKDQNLDLLDSIKKLKGHAERFQLLDLDIELEYDE